MLLIPQSATYNSLGFTPAGFNPSDKFWDYTWELDKDPLFQSNFKEANGLIRKYSVDDNVEHLLHLLNKNNYCGFSDWTVPSVASLKTLNTHPLASNKAIKSINQAIFKHYAAHEDQVINRDKANGGSVDSNYYPYQVEPYFWSSSRTIDSNSQAKTNMNAFIKYQHPSENLTTNENLNEGKLIDQQVNTQGNISGGQYHALRAVRYDRYQRISNTGQALDLDSSDWHCVKDNGPIDNRYNKAKYWTVLTKNETYNDISLLKFQADALVVLANNNSRCGFSDWRLPSQEEIIDIKPMNSDQYFKQSKEYAKTNDYYWLNNTTTDDDEMKLWSHDDDLISSMYLSDSRANALLISLDESSSAQNPSTNCAGADASVEINGTCYKRYDTGKIWTEARDFCIANNASLAGETVVLSIATELASGLSLTTGSTHYWLLDNEINFNRAKALTNYGGWRSYFKDPRYPRPFICAH